MSNSAEDPTSDGRFRELLDGVIKNDPDACRSVVDEYGSHILRAVRRHMNRAIRDRADSEDFAQAVWASFFAHISVVSEMQNGRQLAGFLARMASNKVIDAGRRRRVRHENNAAVSDDMGYAVARDNRRQVAQPTPSEFAVANERWGQLNAGNRYRHLLMMRREGRTTAEIANEMGVSERHVRRILSRLAGRRTDRTQPPDFPEQ